MDPRYITDPEDRTAHISKLVSEAKRIVLFTGAGISTNQGIPDYITLGRRFTEADVGTAEWNDFVSIIENTIPGPVHHWAVQLYKRGVLKRVYTQNIDGLHLTAGLPKELVVEVHGSIKDGVVFDGKPTKGEHIIKADFVSANNIDNIDKPDLCIVIGTRLNVYPFAAIPNLMPRSAIRIFVNRDVSCLPTIKRKKEIANDGIYNSFGILTYTKIAGLKVTIKPTWIDITRTKPGIYLSKWRNQYILELDCDEFINTYCKAN